MKNIGVYLGSFNPVHIGHLVIANWLCEYETIDELWFVVTPLNPFKSEQKLLDDEVRLEWVRKAVGDYPKIRVSDIEMHLPKPNYTIDTMHALQQKYPDFRFTLIMGADNWQGIPKWYRSEELLKELPILVYPRKDYDVVISSDYPNVRLVNAPEIEFSSTFIRESIRAGKDVRFFLPEAIREEVKRVVK